MAILRSPPLQQARRRLNTIPEDIRESQYAKSDSHVEQEAPPKPQSPPQLKLQTTGLSSISARRKRIISPLSVGTASSCSDTEWQHQMQGLNELYDATDIESEGDECPSTSPAETKKYLSLTIPPRSVQGPHKSSPVPPTPPPKIPVSPAALSKLARSVPAVHAPPSLDGSVSSDQVSGTSAPTTPDLQSVPDNDWNTEEVRVHLDLNLEGSQNPVDLNTSSDAQEIEIAIEDTDEDWRQFLGRFPAVPSRTAPHTSTLSLNLDAEPAREPTPDYSINLPEDALDLLRHIHLDGTPEPWSETSEAHEEMWQVDPPQDHIPKTEDATPASALSAYSFTGLSIPSPGGFFAALTPRARHTWSFPKPDNPSSAAAEDFYNLPFGRDEAGEIVEQVIEYYQQSTDEGEFTAVPALEGPPTAVRVPAEVKSPEDQHSPLSPTADTVDEIPRAIEFNTSGEYDEHYHEELQRKAEASRDRTSVWLAAQASYLAALSETNPVNSPVDERPAHGVDDGATGRGSSEHSREKSVRFAETLPEPTSSLPSATASKDSIYWRGFQYLRQVSGQLEAFKHRDLRFDAVQSDRLGLTKLHANRVSGSYKLTRHERPAYKGPFSQAPRHSTLMSILAEKADFSLLEKEQLVLAQIRQSLWAMDALRFLNGGSLLTSPASRRLAKAAATTKSSKNDKRRLRVLDLGGHATCEWGWYLARDNPDVSVYTVFTEQQKVNRGIKGPSNHRQVSVSHLWKLPFGDNKFDVISARSLPALLKTECPTGEDKDEYDLCLQDCYRCLKPGGYLEFFTMDAELSHAAPYAAATSVEFAFNLRTRGYDPNPTKNFLSRLHKTNLTGIKRAWMFLPMGVEPGKCQPPRETSGLCIEGSQLDSSDPAGSTANVASLTGLFGGWMWEQWLLKLQMEMGRDGDRLLEGVGGVFDEGRKNGAGWTCLTGWAMKPRRR